MTTPAPRERATWTAKHKGGLGVVIATENGAHVATVYEHKQANLIAAAPELLEALQGLLHEDGGSIAVSRSNEKAVRAQRAIDKATGASA